MTGQCRTCYLPRIVNGTDALDNEFPWAVGLKIWMPTDGQSSLR